MIGIDFDNTIVCYDDVFGRVASEQGILPRGAATSKTAIRDRLRAEGREAVWTELQGTIYGPRIMDAAPFPGIVAFLLACREADVPVAIVSHRTRRPYRGAAHDLHGAARDWLERHGFHEDRGGGLPRERVFFEETQEAKLARIAALGCTHFVDDLPELLFHPLFPPAVRRILFDPHGLHANPPGLEHARSWSEIAALVAALSPRGRAAHDRSPPPPAEAASAGASAAVDRLCAAAGFPPPLAVERLPGGGNNRVSRIVTAAGPALLKQYFRHPGDPRDRLGAEQAFSRFAWDRGVHQLPRPLAADAGAGIALFEFLAGRRLVAGDVTSACVDEAATFLVAVNRHRDDPAARQLPIASEACFELREHIACVARRVDRLGTVAPESEAHRRAADLVASRVLPLWERVRSTIMAGARADDGGLMHPVPAGDRIVSPSDFGFHNALATAAGLRFFDFEYAGWDDPAKTVCDFFCQPAVPVPREHLERFMAGLEAVVRSPERLRRRVAVLLPVYELKWCCIMLNDFLPLGGDRRAFALGGDRPQPRWSQQLEQVAAVLDRLDA